MLCPVDVFDAGMCAGVWPTWSGDRGVSRLVAFTHLSLVLVCDLFPDLIAVAYLGDQVFDFVHKSLAKWNAPLKWCNKKAPPGGGALG